MFETIAIAAAAWFALNYIVNKNQENIAGWFGEIKLVRKLKNLSLPGKVKVMRDVLFNADRGGTSQVDAIAVTRYGIVVLENKNYSCDIYGDANAREFSCRYPRGGVKNDDPFERTNKKVYTSFKTLYNPFFQNRGHITAIRSALQDEYPNVPFYSLAVFTDANLYIQNKGDKYCNLKQLESTLKRQLKKEVLSDKEVEKIAKILDEKSIKGIKAHRLHIKHVELEQALKKEQSRVKEAQEALYNEAQKKAIFSRDGEIETTLKTNPYVSQSSLNNRPLSELLRDAENRTTPEGTHQTSPTRIQNTNSYIR